MANQLSTNPVIRVSAAAMKGPRAGEADLCEIKDGRVVTTSLKAAKVFRREHYHVLRAIRGLDCSEGFRKSNFIPMFRGKRSSDGTPTYPYYLITRDGFMFLSMCLNGKADGKSKEAYINAFAGLEGELHFQHETERLRGFLERRNLFGRTPYRKEDIPALVREHREHREQAAGAVKSAAPAVKSPITAVKSAAPVVNNAAPAVKRPVPIVEDYCGRRVVSSLTLAGLMGKKHRYVCDSVSRMFKHTAHPNRVFIRQPRTVRTSRGRAHHIPSSFYYITLKGFKTMCAYSTGLSGEVARRVLSAFGCSPGEMAGLVLRSERTTQDAPARPDAGPRGAAAEPAQTPPDMMRRFVRAMAALTGVDENKLSDLMNGGNKR